jgi:hypothetical protein
VDIGDGRLSIRSYRLCFRVERRIHKIDRFRIPLPWGLPLRSIAYAASTAVVLVLVAKLPLLGALLGAAHPVFVYVVVPAFAAYALTVIEPDGRAAHLGLAAWLRWRLGPRDVAGFAASAAQGASLRLADVAVAPDERSVRYRPGEVRGPCRLLLRYPARVRRARSRLVLEQTGPEPMQRGKVLTLGAGQELRLG